MSLFKNIFTKNKSKSAAKSAEKNDSGIFSKFTDYNPLNHGDADTIASSIVNMMKGANNTPSSSTNKDFEPSPSALKEFKDYILTHLKTKKSDILKLTSDFSLTSSVNDEVALTQLDFDLSAAWEFKYISIMQIKAKHESAALYTTIKALLTKEEIFLYSIMSTNEHDPDSTASTDITQSPVVRLKYNDQCKISSALDDALPKFIRKQVELIYFHSTA